MRTGPPPTPYPDVNAVLRDLLTSVQGILGPRLVGMYLDGSLALGDFSPETSDIDFLVATDGPLPNALFLELQAMHTRLAASGGRWALDMEGSYIPKAALRRHDPINIQHYPRLERGAGFQLSLALHASDWVVHRCIVREHGIVLAGPPPSTLIDPVSPMNYAR